MNGGYYHSWWMPWGWIIGLIILIAIIWIISRILYQTQAENQLSNISALDILKQRYARGEISKEEYLEKKDDIT